MDNDKKNQFIFLPYKIKKNQQIIFNYHLTYKDQSYLFQEKIILPQPIFKNIDQEKLSVVLNNLSLILGISYWKTFCPKKIILANYQLTKKQTKFWNIVYTKGLGEFFYKNKVNFRNLINFPVTKKISSLPKTSKLIPLNSFVNKNESKKTILGIGGGKDSIVAAEILKKKNKDFSLFVLYHQKKPPIIEEVIKIINKPVIWIKREIDPQLFKLNKEKTVFNGHVPFNAILSFIGLLIAFIYDFKEIITANENDANEGNLLYLNQEINHQWSKSQEYENLFNQYIKKSLFFDINYYSVLRSFDELQIAEEFSRHPKYFFHFSSCNTNFKIKNNHRLNRWCGQCPKCLFTFLVLALFIRKKTLLKIFQNNLLEKKELLNLYQQLLGLKNNKPFECVGTKDTVTKASEKLEQMKEYQNNFLIQFYINKYGV